MLQNEFFGLVEALVRQQVVFLFSILFSLTVLWLIGCHLLFGGFQLKDPPESVFEFLVRNLTPFYLLVILVEPIMLLLLVIEA